MRVAFFDHCAIPAGAELCLAELVEVMAQQDIDPIVVLGRAGPLLERFSAAAPTRVIRMPQVLFGVEKQGRLGPAGKAQAGLALAAYAIRLAVHLRRQRVELLHVNTLKAGIAGCLAARLARIPVAWYVHDRLTEDYVSSSLLRPLLRVLRVLPAVIIANSRATADTVPAGRPVVVINSPITSPAPVAADSDHATDHRSEAAHRSDGSADQAALTFATLSRLSPWKGQDVFLRAFAAAFPKGPHRAVILGSALFHEDDYAASLPRLAADLDIASRVDFVGHVDDVQVWLRAVDVVVHSPSIPEPFGRVVAEAMAAGKPVIAPAQGGPLEIVTHGENGWLYDPNDDDALVQALRRLAQDAPLRDQLARAAPSAVQRLHPLTIAGELRKAYVAVLADR